MNPSSDQADELVKTGWRSVAQSVSLTFSLIRVGQSDIESVVQSVSQIVKHRGAGCYIYVQVAFFVLLACSLLVRLQQQC